MKKLFSTLLIISTLVGSCLSQQSAQAGAAQTLDGTDAKDILQRAAVAAAKVKSIEYEEEQFHTDHKDDQPFLKSTVRQSKADFPEMGYLPGKFRVEGKKLTGVGKYTQFAYSYDGKSFRILNASERLIKVIKTPTPYIAGQVLSDVGAVGISAFSQTEPFKFFLLKGEQFSYEGKKSINGVECDVIAFNLVLDNPSLGKATTQSRWYIGHEDGLPRGNEAGHIRKTIKILKVNDEPSNTDFYLPILDGYSETIITGNESKATGLLEVGSAAPNWTLVDPVGKKHSLQDYRGKVVVMDFWGTWCVPCWKTMPVIQKLSEKYKDRDATFFGISVVDKEGDPAGFMKRKGYTYNLLLNGDEVAEVYKAIQLPTVYVIGPDGMIRHAEYGYRQTAEDDLVKVIEQSLQTTIKR